MKLLTKADVKRLPGLYETEHNTEPKACVKFFTPDANWTWYAIEYDGTNTFFGLVDGHEKELGYFTLDELQKVRGGLGLPVERDRYFKPTPVKELM